MEMFGRGSGAIDLRAVEGTYVIDGTTVYWEAKGRGLQGTTVFMHFLYLPPRTMQSIIKILS
ncbi:hypothetical protein AN958_09280 [Leucoagaricus sp. SymC.cos]|nr:hypothetical protein AN958_09280 [Leucoagaricus sp. SymC.cos]